MVVMVFIPLGQYTGKCLGAFMAIPGYSMNLAGSLAGTLIFAALSFAWLPPTAWFGVVVLIALLLVRQTQSRLGRINLATALVCVVALGIPGATVWSPYHKLVLKPLTVTDPNGRAYPWGYQLSIGDYYYQDLANLSRDFFQANPNLPSVYQNSEYEVPYKFGQAGDVLVLGAGTGNDVAAALRNGANHVDAVDIDPAILRFGQDFHPEKPYDSPRVTRIVDDPRAFVHTSVNHYDLVLFGLLDSQQVISAFGSVRLDNFVYTVEGIKEAFWLVKPQGLLAITFESYQPWIADRMNEIIAEATGQKPIVIDAHHGTVYIVRKDKPITGEDVAAGTRAIVIPGKTGGTRVRSSACNDRRLALPLSSRSGNPICIHQHPTGPWPTFRWTGRSCGWSCRAGPSPLLLPRGSIHVDGSPNHRPGRPAIRFDLASECSRDRFGPDDGDLGEHRRLHLETGEGTCMGSTFARNTPNKHDHPFQFLPGLGSASRRHLGCTVFGDADPVRERSLFGLVEENPGGRDCARFKSVRRHRRRIPRIPFTTLGHK